MGDAYLRQQDSVVEGLWELPPLTASPCWR